MLVGVRKAETRHVLVRRAARLVAFEQRQHPLALHAETLPHVEVDDLAPGFPRRRELHVVRALVVVGPQNEPRQAVQLPWPGRYSDVGGVPRRPAYAAKRGLGLAAHVAAHRHRVGQERPGKLRRRIFVSIEIERISIVHPVAAALHVIQTVPAQIRGIRIKHLLTLAIRDFPVQCLIDRVLLKLMIVLITFVSSKNKGQGISGRWDAAKKNYGLQGEKDKFEDILKQLKALVDAGEIDPNLTIGQYLGGPNHRFGKLTGKMANRQAQMNKRM